MSKIRQEPVVFSGLLSALAVAVLALCVGAGWIDESDSALIMGIIAAVLAFIPFFVRGKVTPVPEGEEY